ncbi:transcriptional regulator, TetR family [Ruaniaceae bacterium KH17]|nr:transcriptional regulator, TetR family [Ruaniaceae bacterium KH17]
MCRAPARANLNNVKSERSLADAPRTETRRRDTRDALLDAALDGFSRDGFSGTSIRDLARSVGIRESSVYKHFPSKQAIFDALIDRADERLNEVAGTFSKAAGSDVAVRYEDIDEETLQTIARAIFDFVLHDSQFAKLRRLLVIEQYRDADVSARFHAYFVERPLDFQTELFETLLATGEFRENLSPEQTALAFFGPIHMLMQYAEQDEQRALHLLAGHVTHFRRTHLKEGR